MTTLSPTLAISLAALALGTPLLSGCEIGQGEARGQARYNNCAPCHGTQGAGNPVLQAPGLAGLPDWYVELQLRKFRDGARGAHPQDEGGLRMRPMSRTLPGEEDIKGMAAYVGKLPAQRPAPTIKGDATKGKILYATCAACHGERAEGKREVGGPNLHYTGDWYLVSQLKKFKEGIRGTGQGDVTGAAMRPMAMSLADEQAMRDVVAYIQTLSP